MTTANAATNAKLAEKASNWFSMETRAGNSPKKVSILNLSNNKVLADSIKGALQAGGKEVATTGRFLSLFKKEKYDCIITGAQTPWVLAWRSKLLENNGLLIVDNGKTLVFAKDGKGLAAMTGAFISQPCMNEPRFA